ncbi:MAG: hypothetical protein ACFN0W_13095 [Propionibacterium acidifaciens]|uniref:hypothetical protein n=1 Tax=Propionibacterium acidifaciens TaxID=556499 RepID=UPI00361F9B98
MRRVRASCSGRASPAVWASQPWPDKLLTWVVAQAERSLAWVRRVEHDPRCLGLIANHDPEVEPGVRTF